MMRGILFFLAFWSSVAVAQPYGPNAGLYGPSGSSGSGSGCPAIVLFPPTSVATGATGTFAGAYCGTAPTGIDYSTDSGATWTASVSPTIANNQYTFTFTAPAAATYTVKTREQTNTSVVSNTQSWAVTAAPGIVFTTLANGSPSSTIVGSGTYSVAAPSGLTSATWSGGCSGSSTVTGFSASAGAWSATFSTPSGTGTGCILTVTGTGSNTATASSPGVTISSSYSGPGDAASISWFGYWGLNAYTAAIAAAGTQQVVTIRRDSDNATADLLVSTNGGLGVTANATAGSNGVSAATWAGGANLFVKKLYNQVVANAAFPAQQTTNALQPALLLSGGPGGGPYIQFGGTQYLDIAATNTQPFAFSAVATRTAIVGGANSAVMSTFNGAQTRFTTSNVFELVGSSGVDVAAAESAWHSLASNFLTNGAAGSVAVADGTSVTGTPGASSTGGGALTSLGANYIHTEILTGGATEFLMTSTVSVSTPNLVLVGTNQHTRYGF